jgi:tetratricopeptide (TPR) repeat protein
VHVAVNDGVTLGHPAVPAAVTPGRVTWPVLAGDLPPLAEAYNSRPETGLGNITSMPAGETLVLTDQGQLRPEPPRPASEGGTGWRAGGGGTGKTQLAVATARNFWQSGAVELLVWTPGFSRDAILTGYVRALDAIGAGQRGEDAESAAARLLGWLTETTRPWLVVIDDVADLADLDGLWPRGTSGRVLLTSRLPADSMSASKRRVVQIGTFSPRESVNYLAGRLAGDPDQRTGVLDLATDLGGLPLALAQAAALMIDSRTGCRDYRISYAERKRRMAVSDEHAAIVAATWLLSLERADHLPPAGLAWPALVLIALLAPGAVPETVLVTRAACDYICGEPTADDQVHGVLANLARVGLVTLDASPQAAMVRMHALVQEAVRQMLPAVQLDQAVRAAADALTQAWPKDLPPSLAQALRACTATLRQVAGDRLWAPDGHPLLLRAGQSLDSAGLTGPAVDYWRELSATSNRLLGPAHPSTLLSGDKLAAALEAAGRPGEAVALYERGLSERGRLLGWQHAETLAARSRLGQACLASGLHAEAVSLQETTLAGREWALGPDHPDTLATRADLARAYRAAGRGDEAVNAFSAAVSAHEATLGAHHPRTVAARAELVSALQEAGRLKEAVTLQEKALRQAERVHGPDHQDTLTARVGLAHAYRTVGRMKDALPLYKRALAESEQALGPGHPDTLTARVSLAATYQSVRKHKEAIALYERTLTDREKAQGDDHPDTLKARGDLAGAYHAAGRMVPAIPLYEATLAGYLRVCGRDHPDTLMARANLASAYQAGGRRMDAISTLEWTLAECERALPADHPLTTEIRDRLQAAKDY